MEISAKLWFWWDSIRSKRETATKHTNRAAPWYPVPAFAREFFRCGGSSRARRAHPRRHRRLRRAHGRSRPLRRYGERCELRSCARNAGASEDAVHARAIVVEC